jgi:hypothetical protein
MVGAELKPARPPNGEAQIDAALPPPLQKPAELQRIEHLSALVEERGESPIREPRRHAILVSDLDHFEPDMPGEKLLVMLHIVDERGPDAADSDYHDPHDGILGAMEDPEPSERRINIHFSPEVMAGHYANFANVSHSDYEFTITFARVDHEVEDEEIPGVVVARINLSPKFMRELIDAMKDNYSKWETREGIKNLPEYGGSEGSEGSDESE